MRKLQQLFSLRRFNEQPHFVPGDTRESFLARIRTRKLLMYSRLAALILMAAGPIAILFYEQPEGTYLGIVLLLSGIVALFLLPVVAKWELLQKHSEWVSPMLTAFFLIPCAAPVVLQPAQDRGRAFIFLGVAISTYCLSRRSFFVNYVFVALAWILTWYFSGLTLRADDAVFCFLTVPVVGFLICSLQRDSLVSLFDLHQLAVDQQASLRQTLEQLTREIGLRREEERLREESHELLQEQQEQLLHVSRLNATGEMAAGIAHEIRQPLHALSMYAGVLESLVKSEPTDQERIDECVRKIGEIVQHSGEVVRGLQNFTRRRERHDEPIDLETVVRDAVLLTQSELRRRQVTISVDAQRDIPSVLGDSVQLQQVLVNLLRNSCDALIGVPVEERRIEVSVWADSDWVETRVEDSGCGLTDEQAARVFETFYTTKDDGLGMGMSISRRIIEDHGGTLEYISPNGSGAIFLIRLPASGTDDAGTIHGGSASLSD
jgi:signal transduction histidine kinase